jgi:hypothetical protein
MLLDVQGLENLNGPLLICHQLMLDGVEDLHRVGVIPLDPDQRLAVDPCGHHRFGVTVTIGVGARGTYGDNRDFRDPRSHRERLIHGREDEAQTRNL